jgi:hypothetical protein
VQIVYFISNKVVILKESSDNNFVLTKDNMCIKTQKLTKVHNTKHLLSENFQLMMVDNLLYAIQ